MDQVDQLKAHFQNRTVLLNIILDGYGLGSQDETNGIYMAKTPCMDDLLSKYANTTLFAHGNYVGLPADKDMGGSEVGHLTIGAGKIIEQGASYIKKIIDEGSFFELPELKKNLQLAKQHAVHLIGLLSDGNVHSHIDHFIALIRACQKNHVQRCFVHALLDGRDTYIQSALDYVEQIEDLFLKIKQENPSYQYQFASGGGRETITMDRAENWDKVQLGWQTHVEGNSGRNFHTMREAIEFFRTQNPTIIDQDLPPFNILNKKNETIKINDHDTVIVVNFRGDRAIELTRAFEEENFNYFSKANHPKVNFVGMTTYDEDTDLPKKKLVSSTQVAYPFGKRLVELGLDQFRLAETQKFPHVTFFFNGGYRLPLDENKEYYCKIESDNLDSFAEKPEMKALQIAKKACEILDQQRFRYGLINFANPDMVGHTGDMKAVIKAVETVDLALSIILKKLETIGGIAIVTADHGNADEMLIFNTKTQQREVSTKHSLNPVPFVIFDPKYQNQYRLKTSTPNQKYGLSHIAATNFILLGLDAPDDLDAPLFDL